MYTLERESDRYYQAVIGGFFDQEECARFATDMRALARRPERPPIFCLVDGSNAAVQSQETLAIFAELRTELAGIVEMVVVLPSALGRLQAKRISGDQVERIFPDRSAAENCIQGLIDAAGR